METSSVETSLLDQAFEEGHLRRDRSGRFEKVIYTAVNRSERWSDAEEKVRATFYAELIYRYGYSPDRIGVEITVPDRSPNDYADLVVFRDDERKRPFAVIECKAEAISDAEFAQAVEQAGGNEEEQTPPVISRSPLLNDFAPRFLAWLDFSHLTPGTRRYYRVGWGMIRRTRLISMTLNRITSDEAWAANFPGSPSAVNNALRTLHRMLSKAVDWKVITRAPKIHLAKEVGRSQLMSPETEAKLLSVADQPLRDVIMIMQDGGMRPAEVFRMSVEHIDWQRKTIFVPFGKTRNSRRFVPTSERVMKALMVRVAERAEGWVFPSKRSRSGHIETVEKQFLDARARAGLGDDVVLYSARHTFCTYALEETGNLAALMKVAGHADVKTAMKYQHPEMNSIREAIERRNQCHNSRHSPAENDTASG